MNAWNVYLKGRLIDTLFCGKSVTADEVYRGLVHHDGYESGIVVRKRRTKKAA